MTDQPVAQGEAELAFSPLSILLVVAENARLLVFWPLAIGLLALGYAFTITPTFTAKTTILPPQQQQRNTAAVIASQLGALSGLVGLGGSGINNSPRLYVALIESRTVADRIVDRFDLLKLYRKKTRQDTRKKLQNVTKVTTGKDGLVAIEVDDEDPRRAAAMANAYVEELSRLTDGLAITEAQQRRKFFEHQLQAAQENLNKAQRALDSVGVPESVIKSSPVAVLEAIGRLRAMVTAQEIRISTMHGYLTEQSPAIQLAQRELESLRAQLAKAERDQPAASGKGAEYLDRLRDFKYQETLFELLAKQYEAARLDEAREGAFVQVVDVAQPPERKSRPAKARIAVLTTLASGLLLLMFVLVREAIRNARRDPESAGKLARIGAALRALVGRAG
jgi:tyrosine-protein kinase Etk/Wzc